MSRIGTDYHVARPTATCAVSGETLEPGTPCVAALCEREDADGFERFDYSLEAWESGARPERMIGHWRLVVPDREARQSVYVDDSVLVDLFDRLAGDERPQRVAFRFVLALILLRKRRLRFVGRREAQGDSPEHWLMRVPATDPELPPIEVVNPQLGEADVRELTTQISEVLQSEL